MLKKTLRRLLILSLSILVLAGCQRKSPRYVIGVSQCSTDIWREKQNAELRMGTYFYDGVEVRFASAYDSDERQVQQIDSLIRSGIDLLIVAPNQVQTISPAIDRAYDQGIPVIVFERKTNSKKYTAFIGADNYEMGRQMGEYVAARLGGQGRVVEIMGLKGSSPAIERHKGFTDAIARYPRIETVATLQGDWTEESGYEAVASHGGLTDIDFVFGQNDRMAIGARRAMLASARGPIATRFCGIDGLPGEGGGIASVRDSVLDASYIYPTHGDQVMQLAMDILEGRPYATDARMKSALVTRDNANVLLLQNEETARQTHYLDQLHERSDSYLQELDQQRTITLLAVGVIGLLLLVMVLYYLYHQGKINLRRERVVNNLWNLEMPEAPAGAADGAEAASADTNNKIGDAEEDAPSAGESSSAVAAPSSQESAGQPAPVAAPAEETSVEASRFIARFREVVEARLAQSELTVETLAADMNLSRVQLYRRVKTITGSSPVELLRTARLNRGYQMLLTTDKNVSEVAYEVGFSAPSYFTKCFKDEFGISPSDL